MGRLQAVLFDMDGTLIDSEKVWFVAEAQLMAELGWQGVWGEEHQHELVGGSIARTIEYMRLKVTSWRPSLAAVLPLVP